MSEVRDDAVRDDRPGDAGPSGSADASGGTDGSGRADDSGGAAPGRSTGLVVLMVGLLIAGWFADLWTLLTLSYPSGAHPLGEVLAWYVVGAVVSLGLPVVVLVREARGRRRDRSRRRDLLVASVVLLVLGLATHGWVVGGQTKAVVDRAVRVAQPPTAAERHFEGRDVGAELTALGDETVRVLGGDLEATTATGEDAVDVFSRECTLQNSDPGVEWTYRYSPTSLVDAAGVPYMTEPGGLLPTATADLDAAAELLESRGFTVVRDTDADGGPVLLPEADWSGYYTYMRPGPYVDLDTTCLVAE